MMTTLFTDNDGTEMAAFVNTKGNPVVRIDSDDDCLVYVFENDEEIDDFIEVLIALKLNPFQAEIIDNSEKP